MLEGGLSKRTRAAIFQQIEATVPDEPLVVAATGQYVGEGVDCPQLDTLFLAFPISFKDRLVQYTGRLMRAHDGKTSVRVYAYADTRVPVLRAMHRRRLATHKSLGFTGRNLYPRDGGSRVGEPGDLTCVDRRPVARFRDGLTRLACCRQPGLLRDTMPLSRGRTRVVRLRQTGASPESRPGSWLRAA